MTHRRPISCFLFAAILVSNAAAAPPIDLAERLEALRGEDSVPAVAAAVVRGGELIASGAVGVRRIDSAVAVTIEDRFHIGSCGKSMTAALIGTLVDDGLLSWETTIEDVLADDVGDVIRAEYRSVNVRHLLSHTAALPNPWEESGWPSVDYPDATSPSEHRLAMAREVLALPPIGEPGAVQQYSNHGYGIASIMAERVTSRTWEQLIVERLFEPLGLDSAGIGAPALSRMTDQPWGHVRRDDVVLPVDPADREFRVPISIAPAGDIHSNVADFARWAANRDLLTPATWDVIRTPVMGNYALGWRIETTSGGTEVHMHNGSDGTFYATMAFFPEYEMSVVVFATVGGSGSLCNTVIFALANEFAE